MAKSKQSERIRVVVDTHVCVYRQGSRRPYTGPLSGTTQEAIRTKVRALLARSPVALHRATDQRTAVIRAQTYHWFSVPLVPQ